MGILMDLFRDGGPVMFAIAAVSLSAWSLALNSWNRMRRLQADVHSTRSSLAVAGKGGRTAVRKGISSRFSLPARLARLEQSLGLVRTFAAVLPLLGLLGTVLGMVVTFRVIQSHGTGEPVLVAEGIRQALLTTQAGLWAALPVILLHQILASRARRLADEVNLIRHERDRFNRSHAGQNT